MNVKYDQKSVNAEQNDPGSEGQRVLESDPVFGEITEGGPNYHNVGWVGSAVLMIKTQIGLGVLSIPTAFDALGMIPGLICLCVVAAMATWSGHVVGTFKARHRSVYCIDDAVGLMFGSSARRGFTFMFPFCWTLVAGSGMLGASIGLNALSSHATCTAVFVAVAATLTFAFASIRTLGRISWLAWMGVTSLLVAILVVTIGVCVQDRPAAAPQTGHWVSDYQLFKNPTFDEAVAGVSVFMFALGGTSLFFPIAAEMRDLRHYSRSLLTCQAVVTGTYIVIGCVVYRFCGSYVASPALGSAGPTIKKASYGIALPGLLATTTLVVHVSSKHIFVRILRDSRHLVANTFTHWACWLGCNFGVAGLAYIIASAVPDFGGLVALVGALFGTLMAFQPMGCMWLYDNWGLGKEDRSLKWVMGVCWASFVVLAGMFLMTAGTYGAIQGLIESHKGGSSSGPWSCNDNSNSS